MKEYIIPTLINKADNENILKEIPHKNMLDLSIVYRFVIENEDGISSALITDEVMGSMGLSAEELSAVAEENFRLGYAPEVYDLDDTVKVITSKKRIFGALGMFDIQLLQSIAEELRDDLYILPVSVHEVIIAAANNHTLEQLKSIMEEGRRRFASEGDFLTESVYIFLRSERRINMAIK